MRLSTHSRMLQEMDHPTRNRNFERKNSELEAIDSLCEEIHALLHDSKMFEEQYKGIMGYYRDLSRQNFT